ncbi:MAG: hypothetical protein U9Q12_00305 [Patescibacteria group bacterium]|nr:hypothetical protein [Patescibacteria group bacterium]
MKYFFITILFVSIFVLSGCVDSSGSANGGVLRSEDEGRTFVPYNIIDEEHSLARYDILSLAIDPSNNDIVYAGTKSHDMFISENGAQSWIRMQTALTNIASIVVNPFNTQTLYVGGLHEGRGIVVKSVDAGQTWERVYIEPQDGTNITAMVTSPVDGNMVYIGTSGGTIARTLDGGATWENLYHAKDNKPISDLRIDAGDTHTLYALIHQVDVVKSRDDGITFESINDMEREDDAKDKVYDGKLYSMAVSPAISGAIVVGTDEGVFRSEDYGYTWNPVDVIASTIGIPIHAIEISPHNANQLVYVAAKAVYTSVGGSWSITDTASNRSVSVIMHDPIDANIIYLGLIETE